MALSRKNKIPPYHTTSAADTIKETLVARHLSAEWLSNQISIGTDDMTNVLKREDYLDKKQLKQVEALIGVPARLLWNLDSNYLDHSKESSIIKAIHDIQRGNYRTDTHYLPPAGEVSAQDHKEPRGHGYIDWDGREV